MAEFCKTCAYKLGMRPDRYPLLCENCGKNYARFNLWVALKNLYRKVLGGS